MMVDENFGISLAIIGSGFWSMSKELYFSQVTLHKEGLTISFRVLFKFEFTGQLVK